jgi:dienelactone hydrolase
MDRLPAEAEQLCASSPYDFSDLRAVFINCTLKRSPEVDPARIIVFGASMGGNFAPLVAAGEPVAGVMIWGGGAKSWFERTLGFERRAKEFGAVPAAELDGYLRALERFLVAYLLDRKDPATIVREQPALAGIWEKVVGTGAGTHYGRPLAFHQQAAAQDWAAAWARIDAPVLALYGALDNNNPTSITGRAAETAREMRRINKVFEWEVYNRAPHAFFRAPDQSVSESRAAVQAWDSMLEFLGRYWIR